MAKTLLKITKPDKTTHIVPAQNKAYYQKRNRLAKKDDQWKIESISEEEAKNVAFIDENYVTGAEAVAKAEKLEGVVSQKDDEIAQLKKQLAELSGGPKYSAAQAIALISVAKTAEEVDDVAKGDDRTTVKDAAKERKAELKKAQ
jgi:Na+-translocating ferredoxin:NAD+ oxidoreductase RNF subunit RnfB